MLFLIVVPLSKSSAKQKRVRILRKDTSSSLVSGKRENIRQRRKSRHFDQTLLIRNLRGAVGKVFSFRKANNSWLIFELRIVLVSIRLDVMKKYKPFLRIFLDFPVNILYFITKQPFSDDYQISIFINFRLIKHS